LSRLLTALIAMFLQQTVRPRLVMACLALGMACSVALTGLFTAAWPIAAIGLVSAVLSATAMSWHGILLSETARLAPRGSVGAVTGGVLSVGQIGAFLGPSAFAFLLRLTGGYGLGWVAPVDPAPQTEHLGYRMIALEVDDMQKMADYLKTKGVDIVWGPRVRETYSRAEICDPNGYRIELRQWFR